MGFMEMFESLCTPEERHDKVVAGDKILYSFKHAYDTSNPTWYNGYAIATAGNAVQIGYSLREGCCGTWYNQSQVRIRKVVSNETSCISFEYSSVVFGVTTFIPPFFGLSPELWANLAKVAATGFSLIWNFIGYKFIVFKK